MSSLDIEKQEISNLVAKLEVRRKAIGVERDKLRDIISEYEELIDSCDRAEEHIECAVEALSEFA